MHDTKYNAPNHKEGWHQDEDECYDSLCVVTMENSFIICKKENKLVYPSYQDEVLLH